MFVDDRISQPRVAIRRANSEENDCQLAGINMNAARRSFPSNILTRRVA